MATASMFCQCNAVFHQNIKGTLMNVAEHSNKMFIGTKA